MVQPRAAGVQRTGPFRPPVDRWLVAVLVVAAATLIALVGFDLSPPLAFNDDWMYAWSVRQLVAGHGLHAFPESTALALVQVLWGAIFSVGHPDPRLLRLSIVPAVALIAGCSYWLARRLGADRFWAAVAGATLLAMPLFIGNATTFMSDTLYVALVMGVAAASVMWVTEGRWRWLCVALIALTPLQRQLGLALVPALTLALVIYRRHSWTRTDTIAAALLWSLPATALFAADRVMIAEPLYPTVDLSQIDIGHAIFPLPAMLGLGLIPYLAALALRPGPPARENHWSLAWAALGVVGAIGCLVDLARFGMTFPGNVFSTLGFTAILPGAKPAIFPGPVFQAVEIASIVTFVSLLILRRRWWSHRMRPDATMLVLVAAAQFLPLLAVNWFIFDRYFLPVIAPLVPLVAALATAALRQRVARSWAVAALAAGFVLYVVGEQDYLAWQTARDQAARLAYQTFPRDQVQAGFEANAVYVELPRYERSGQADLFAILGPLSPRITLRFAPASDPRPGVPYRSLASGKIVLDR
jgi:hypothetical protein